MKTSVITLNDIKVHYRAQGAPPQPTLVLIHGLGCSLNNWACVFDAPELTHYHILALDLPGFGLSAKPDDYDYSLPAQAEIVFAFLQTQQVQNVTIIGHSMGGAIAILLAHKHPTYFNRLLVVEPNLKARDAQLSRDIIRQSEADFVTHYEEFRQNAILTVQDWFVNTPQTGIQWYMDDLQHTTPISMYRSAHSLITVTTGDTLMTQFQQLALQKYFLIGAKTIKTRQIPKSLRDGTIQTIIVPGVGHMMMMDNPQVFNQTLTSILQ
jgi:pimeloyl-ACP methyl ester carboxylesterase